MEKGKVDCNDLQIKSITEVHQWWWKKKCLLFHVQRSTELTGSLKPASATTVSLLLHGCSHSSSVWRSLCFVSRYTMLTLSKLVSYWQLLLTKLRDGIFFRHVCQRSQAHLWQQLEKAGPGLVKVFLLYLVNKKLKLLPPTVCRKLSHNSPVCQHSHACSISSVLVSYWSMVVNSRVWLADTEAQVHSHHLTSSQALKTWVRRAKQSCNLPCSQVLREAGITGAESGSQGPGLALVAQWTLL